MLPAGARCDGWEGFIFGGVVVCWARALQGQCSCCFVRSGDNGVCARSVVWAVGLFVDTHPAESAAAFATAAMFDQVDRDLRTEEQLYGNSSSSSYSRPAAYTYAYGGRRADSDYGFEDFFRRTAAGGGSSSGGTYQPQARPRPGPSAGGGGGWPGSGAAGRGQAGSRWYENNHWADNDEEDLESEEDEYDGYGHGGSGWHYSNPRSKY